MRRQLLALSVGAALSVGILLGLGVDDVLVAQRLIIASSDDKTALVAMADERGRGQFVVYDEQGDEVFAVRRGTVSVMGSDLRQQLDRKPPRNQREAERWEYARWVEQPGISIWEDAERQQYGESMLDTLKALGGTQSDYGKPSNKGSILNQAGRLGWELCAVDTEGSTVYFFKRRAE